MIQKKDGSSEPISIMIQTYLGRLKQDHMMSVV